MISFRGPKKVLVSDRTAIPVADFCSAVIYSHTLGEVKNKLPATDEEIFEALGLFVERFGPNKSDFIEICCEEVDDDTSIDIVGISDWAFIAFIMAGRDLYPNSTYLGDLYSAGVTSYMLDCLNDHKNQTREFADSTLHVMLFDAFKEAYGELGDDVDDLISSLEEAEMLLEMDEQ